MLIWKASSGLWSRPTQALRSAPEESPVPATGRLCQGRGSRAARLQAQGRLGEGAARTTAGGSQNIVHISLLQSGKESLQQSLFNYLFFLMKTKYRKYSPNLGGINHINIMTIHNLFKTPKIILL